MTDVGLERRLLEAFADVRATVEASSDLFARVTRTLADARDRRRFRLRLVGCIVAFIAANAAFVLAVSDLDNGRLHMPWWSIELVTNVVLIALAIGLGPFIKRFGRAYAADVFRANPRTGKSYLVLTDVAYYLIFTSFVLFTVRFEEQNDWRRSTGAQLKDEVARVGGILLIMGVLHAANVVALPVIGRLLSSNKRLDETNPTAIASAPGVGVPPLGQGTWIVHVEQAPGSSASEPPT